jgi:hypothetical protein
VICPVDKSLFSEGLQNIPCQICCLLISLGYCLQSGDMPCWAICLAGRNSVWWQCNYHSLHLRGCSFIKGVSHHSLGQAYSNLLLQTLLKQLITQWELVAICGKSCSFVGVTHNWSCLTGQLTSCLKFCLQIWWQIVLPSSKQCYSHMKQRFHTFWSFVVSKFWLSHVDHVWYIIDVAKLQLSNWGCFYSTAIVFYSWGLLPNGTRPAPDSHP